MAEQAVDANGAGNGEPDPGVVRRFHFTREMIRGPVYRKYKFAINRVWNVDDLDFTQDVADWERITPEQRKGLLGVTVRFLAGEQAVTDELVPMIAASHALGRFDWVTYLSTFLMEEAKHAEFFMRWHSEVVGILEPEEVARHFLVRGTTVDPSGRFEVRDILHEAVPTYGRALLEASMGGNEEAIERAFIRFSTAYNAFVEGVLTMPSYEIVIDTTELWGVLPALISRRARRLTREIKQLSSQLTVAKPPRAASSAFASDRGTLERQRPPGSLPEHRLSQPTAE